MKKGKSLLAVIITIIIMLLVFVGLVFAGIKLGVLKIDMSILSFGKEEKQEENPVEEVDIYSKEYNVDDYVSVTKDEESGLKLVSFKKVENNTLEKFKELQESFKSKEVNSANKKTNTVRTNANRGVLSVYTKETVKNAESILSETSYAVNVNVESNKEVKNSELIALYDSSEDAISKAVINKFLELSTDIVFTDSANAQVKSSDIKTDSTKYISVIKENIENLVIYIRKDKLYVDVNPTKLMEILGLKVVDTTKLVEITSVAI